MPSWTPPTTDQVDSIIAHLGHVEQYRHFFERNSNPLWLKPLADRGIFKSPPDPVQVDWSSGPVHAVWPASRYLVRMAEHDPQAVYDIVRSMPDTANVTVQRDIVDIALAMPSQTAAQLLSHIIPWVKELNDSGEAFFSLADGLGQLVAHLARGGETQPALRVAKELLKVTTSERPDDPGGYIPHNRRVTARCSVWEYGKILERDVPVLVEHAGLAAVHILVKQLKSALWITRNSGGQPEPDYSVLWRPAIEPHDQNLSDGHDISGLLISIVRDAVSTLVDSGTFSVRDAIAFLEEEADPVLRRIAVHVLRSYGERDLELVTHYVTERTMFDDVALHHEYALLLRSFFSRLSEDTKNTLLAWIAEGPERTQIASRIEKARGEAASNQEIEQAAKHWQLEHLAIIRQHLPPEWQDRCQRLVTEFDEPQHPEFLTYTEVRMGDESPIASSELRTMSPQEIAATVRNWRPEYDPFGPSVEGLAHAVGEAARSRAEEMSSQASLFIGAAPPYIRQLLGGWREAVTQGDRIDWAAVLALCQWLVQEPRDTQGIVLSGMLDPDWGWARAGAAHLFYIGLDTSQGEIPFTLRGEVWEVLRLLTMDPDPSVEQEVGRDGSSLQSLSINSVRGEALHAVVKYALWLRRNMDETGDKERVDAGFGEMPEVRDVLDYHLDVLRDPSLAIRAVYGQWLPWLVLLDTRWVERALPLLFPEAPEKEAYWQAAWQTYVTMSAPYDATFELIRDVYERAVDAVADSVNEKNSPDRAAEHLAEHLMVFYWRGKIDMGERELVERFFTNAHDELRGHAIEFVGHSLHNTSAPVPGMILDRLQRLWESRLAEARCDLDSHKRELGAFSWWAAAEVFDDNWVLGQLKSLVESGVALDVPDLVVEYIAKMATLDPGESVLLLNQMLKGADEWSIRRWIPEMRTILAAAARSTDETVSTRTSTTIHELGRRGHHAFRDLLPE
jgi:hypothetical protein